MKHANLWVSTVLVLTLLFTFTLHAAENSTMIHIQRSLKAMEESTAEHPAHLRVMFYGQSIVAQAWTEIIQKKLREKYPTVEFEFFNGAIGGCESPVLRRTAQADLYPWYPDLLFFNVYGPIEYYEEIIKTVHARTSAEIIIWTSHLSEGQNPKEMLIERDQRSRDILGVAKRNNCTVIDLNKKWCSYLIDKGLEPKVLLADNIHLNPAGCELYANLLWEDIARVPGTSGEPNICGTITEIAADDPSVIRGANGELTLEFTGNRVTAISDGTAEPGEEAELFLDGKPLAEHKELWTNTRPSTGPCWMPAISCVGIDKLPVKEDWTLSAIDGTQKDGSLIIYKVEGSETGFDGEGRSDQPFISNSGRVKLEVEDMRMVWQFAYFKSEVPEHFQVTWSTIPMFADPYITAPVGTRTLLLQHCENGTHKLTIRPKSGNAGIGKWIINAPAVK